MESSLSETIEWRRRLTRYLSLLVTFFFTLNALLADVWELPQHAQLNKPYMSAHGYQMPLNNPSHLKVTFSVTDGKLPKGLTLTRDGYLRGKPEEGGDF